MPRLRPDQTLHNRTYERLREALMTGAYKPGQKITIRAVASAFGTSTTPVREALRRLAAEGALEVLPNRTVRIPPLTAVRLGEITRIRTQLEGLAAHAAASAMSADEIGELERLQRAMAAAADRRDFAAYLALNKDFHFALYRGARMPNLLRLIDSMWLQSGPFLNVLLPSMRGIDRHARAIEAIRRRDPGAARKAIVSDVERAARHLMTMLREQPAQIMASGTHRSTIRRPSRASLASTMR